MGVYRDHADPNAKDAAVAAIVAQVFGRLTTGKIDVPALLNAVLTEANPDQLQLWSSDRELQRQIRAAGLAGTFGDEEGPITTVRLINAAGNKLDAFAGLSVGYTLGACSVSADGLATRSSTLEVTLRNDAPKGLPKYMTGRADLPAGADYVVGSNRDYVAVYAPANATVTQTRQDGQPAFVHGGWIGSRQVVIFDVVLDPGKSSSLTVTWDEPAVSTEEAALPLDSSVVLPPLARPAIVDLAGADPCR